MRLRVTAQVLDGNCGQARRFLESNELTRAGCPLLPAMLEGRPAMLAEFLTLSSIF